MLIADPHFRDSSILPRKPSWLTSITEFVVHLNLRKSWNAASRLNPHVVIVLGDMLHQGRAIMTDEECVSIAIHCRTRRLLTFPTITRYDRYYQKFYDTFRHDKFVQFYYVPGNHDVG